MRGLARAMGLVVVLAVAGAASAAAQAPPIPVPPVHLPKPDQVAVFEVVVEGKATDDNHSQLSGQVGLCLATEDGHVVETDTYRRGKALRMEFARYGNTVIVQRPGRLGDASLAVAVTIHRTAEGGTSYAPAMPGVPCNVPPTDLSQNADCGVDKAGDAAAMVLTYKAPKLGLDVSPKTKLKAFGGDSCGEDQQTGISDELFFAWPNPPALQGANLPLRRVFGRNRGFTIQVRAQEAGPIPHTVSGQFGPLRGTVTDSALNSATLRFVRTHS
jgi:hypothetical protein